MSSGNETLGTSPRWRRRAVRSLLTVISLGIAVFWVWALFFPQTKQSVAKLDDEQWAERATAICRQANVDRDELSDLRRIDEVGDGALATRADLIDRATNIIEQMVNDVVAERPTFEDDIAILKTWTGYYREWIVDRRIYADVLREGRNPPFAESMVDGAPITEYINDFTVANRMKPCSAPTDLAV